MVLNKVKLFMDDLRLSATKPKVKVRVLSEKQEF